ncbi:tetratricopeptide repeat protein [Persephonella sp.]
MLRKILISLIIPFILFSCFPTEENRVPSIEYQKGLGKKIRNEKAAKIYRATGYKYYKLGDYDQAFSFYNKALLKYRELSMLHHPEAAELYLRMGDLYLKTKSYKEALRYYSRALKIFKKNYGQEHFLTATAYKGLGSVYEQLSEYKKAYYFYSKCLSVYEKELGKKHKNIKTLKEKIKKLAKAINKQ